MFKFCMTTAKLLCFMTQSAPSLPLQLLLCFFYLIMFVTPKTIISRYAHVLWQLG